MAERDNSTRPLGGRSVDDSAFWDDRSPSRPVRAARVGTVVVLPLPVSILQLLDFSVVTNSQYVVLLEDF